MSLDVNEVFFEEKQDISNKSDKSRKSKTLMNDADAENETQCSQMLST